MKNNKPLILSPVLILSLFVFVVFFVQSCGQSDTPQIKAPIDESAEASDEEKFDASAYEAVEAASEVQAELPAEVAVEAATEEQAELPAEVAVEAATEEQAELPAEVAAEAVTEEQAELPIEVAVEAETEEQTEIPAEVAIEASDEVATVAVAEASKIVPTQTTYKSSTNFRPVIDRSNNTLLYIVIAILSLTTLLSVAISFYLYKWRRILLSNKNMVVPEEWAKYLQKLGESMDSFSRSVGNGLENLTEGTNNNSKKISNMTETYMELQSALDEKDSEIKRLKNGYDAEIFRRFISRFSRIEQSIDDFILEDGESEALIFLRKLFEDAFDECGVSRYEPPIGDDYRKAVGVSDNPKTVTTDNPEKEFLISEILEAGYQLNTGMDKKIIIPAKVRIYTLG